MAAHGKLLWDPTLMPLAYASNVGELFVYEIDLLNRTLVNAYDVSRDLPNDGSCVGTHSIQYSSVNRQYVGVCPRVAWCFCVNHPACVVHLVACCISLSRKKSASLTRV